MKKFLAIALIFVITSCQSTGNPWQGSSYNRPAESAPSRLTKEVPAPEGQVYAAYESPEERAANQQQTQDRQILENYNARMESQPPQNDFEANIGNGRSQNYESPAAFSKSQALPSVKVALLLPLSGEHADLGQAILQASQLALFDMGYDAFELMPRDTRGTPQGATQAAQSVAAEGAQLILGPLFADSVRAAKPIARRYNINMVAFSTDWSLAGGNTYIMGFLPFAQVQRVSEYAAANGVQNIGILAPNTDYGNAVIAAYNSLAYRTGLNTAEVVKFPVDETDVSEIVRSFTNYDQRTYAKEQGNPAPLPFDAVLLPAGGDHARSIGNLLSFYDLGPEDVRRLGTGLWDDRGLATEPALNGSWFAAPSPDLRRSFEDRYRDTYGSKPPRLATLGYDATALAAVLAKQSYQRTGQTSFTRDALVNPNGFAGIDGIFRFRPDGLVERGLAILEYKGGTIAVKDPAPSTFQRRSY